MSRWGEPTQTFVRREAAAVEALGATVEAWSIKRPTGQARWLPPRRVLLSALRAVARRPLAAARLFGTIVRHASWRNVSAHLAAATVGVAWSSDRNTPDLLHCHFGWVSATATWAFARMSDRPYSVVLHAFELHTRRFVDGFTPIPLRESSCVFTISERDMALVMDRWGLPSTVLRMGVPRAWLAPPPSHETESNAVVSVGSLLPKKGHDVLVRAVAQLPEHVELDIVGEGPMRAELANLIDELGVSGRVRLRGACSEDEVRALVARSTVFVLASVQTPDGDRDGIPVALMEAMALWCPVVATRVGAIDELVEGRGVLVPPGDVDRLRDAIAALLADPTRRRELAGLARSEIERGWLVEDSAAQVLSCSVGR